MPKRSIRAQFLAERKSRSAEDCVDSSLTIQQKFLNTEAYRSANCVALYSPILNEVRTSRVARRALEDGKTLTYPRVNGENLEFVLVHDVHELAKGAFDVLEPVGEGLVPVEELDLVVVPGVVFDQDGHRLGYGRGFYDRALSRCHRICAKVGFAYDFQLVEALPSAGHDETLSVLITENRMLTFSA